MVIFFFTMSGSLSYNGKNQENFINYYAESNARHNRLELFVGVCSALLNLLIGTTFPIVQSKPLTTGILWRQSFSSYAFGCIPQTSLEFFLYVDGQFVAGDDHG